MCGIAGIFRFDGAEPPRRDLDAMLGALAHRGPDASGVHAEPGLLLGNRRLAVIDPEGGTQPMATADGARVVTYNGEIHDYLEHRERMAADGVRFRTRSDTEVLLELLARRGVDGLADLSGMFAFALWERATRALTLVRDPFGVKPLLYAFDAARGEVRFASELGALLAGTAERPRLDLEALAERAAFQVPLTGRTLVDGVRSVPPGGAVRFRDGARTERVWRPAPRGVDEDAAEAELVTRLRGELRRAVSIALRSDVAVGTTLSGGLDSSLVTALAADVTGERVTAFTGFFEEGEAYDERPHARRAAAAIGVDLVEVPVRPDDLVARVRELATRLEGPIAGPGSLPQLVVADAAAERVTVLLTGQGADEVFGGYARMRIAWLAEAGRLDAARLPADLVPYRPLVEHLLAAGEGTSFAGRWFRLVWRGQDLETLVGPALAAACERFDSRAAFGERFAGGDDPWRAMLDWEQRTLLPALLHVEDRVTMARSLESRVPLLDPRIPSLAATVPARIAFGDGEPKRLLRRAARGIAPACAVERRDKMGFPVPLGEWARGPLAGWFRERLEDGPLVDEGVLAPGAPERLLAEAGGHGRHLWFFLLLSEWMAATGARP